MSIKIYSKLYPHILLHIIQKAEDIDHKRTDVVPPNEFIQTACFTMPIGKTFRPHKHIEITRYSNITQESWICIKGKVKAILYDIDDTVIHEEVLGAGDCSVTLRGGHNYESMEEGTLVYEYKIGPYTGLHNDKVFID